MAYPDYRTRFGDTTFTKVFVGGLAWETPTEVMRRYFEQFGEILEAVIITDKITGKSKGYGFVTFREPESARRACADPNPVIGGRRANCNIAFLGRPRPSPPRGRPQGGNPYQQGTSGSYSGVATPLPPPPPPPIIYPHYGYQPYSPDYGYHHQALYSTQVQQPQYYHQVYGTSSSSTMASPYYYGYSFQAPQRGAISGPQPQRLPGPSFFYYPTNMEATPTGSYLYPPLLPLPSTSRPFHDIPSSASEPQAQRSNTADDQSEAGGAVKSESSNT